LSIFTNFYEEATRYSFEKNVQMRITEEFERKVAGKKIMKFYLRKKKFLSRLYLHNNETNNTEFDKS